MASSLGCAGGPGGSGLAAAGGGAARRPNLEFPPPPPYPPPHNRTPGPVHLGFHEYACDFECEAAERPHYVIDYHIGQLHPQQYLLLQQEQLRADTRRKHTYLTRYGTEENIYEEISEIK